MYFYWGFDVVFLFETWKSTTAGSFVLCWLVTFVLAIAIEYLNYLRYVMQCETYSRMNQILSSDEPGEVYKFQFFHRFKLFIVYFLSLMLSYFLMLIVMTFNAGLFIAA